MKTLVLPVGPPGSGKSTLAREFEEKGYLRISQDVSGRQHLAIFEKAISEGKDVYVDRLNFTKDQRTRYLSLAKANGYTTGIIVLHVPYNVCYERCMARQDHETIKDHKAASSALNMFFSKYERVEDSEADVVERRGHEGLKPLAVIFDLDGTICDVEHRRHFVNKPKGEKKDWVGFFKGMTEDKPNGPVVQLARSLSAHYSIVFCSGRPDNYRKETLNWLEQYNLLHLPDPYIVNVHAPLYMRLRNDSRQDDIVKEILLDFEILTRYKPAFMVDDRDQVVAMWRKRGYTCFQCAPGDF